MKKIHIFLLCVFLSQHDFKDRKALKKVVDSKPTPSMYTRPAHNYPCQLHIQFFPSVISDWSFRRFPYLCWQVTLSSPFLPEGQRLNLKNL